MNREEIKDEFLKIHGWGESSREHLAGDASFRSYERIHRPVEINLALNAPKEVEPFSAQTIEFAVLMDAPPAHEDIKPFVNIANILRKIGLNAPEIIAHDEVNGFVLLEDFGDGSYNRILGENDTINPTPQAVEIYKKAIDVLTELHKHRTSKTIPNYDNELLKKELSLFNDWYICGGNNNHHELVPTSANKQFDNKKFSLLWNDLFKIVNQLDDVIVLRDYHADNLMWLDNKTGISQVGLLDFQDAVNGSPAYDLVSLLEDARRDISFEFADEMLDYYIENNGHIDADLLRQSYAILGAQRNIKILGIFSRLAKRDGKKQYLNFIPRVWKYLEHDLQHPLLKDVRKFMSDVKKY